TVQHAPSRSKRKSHPVPDRRPCVKGRGYMTFKLKAASVAAVTMLALMCGTAQAEPKVLMLHQWASGNDAASIAKLGELFTAAGGTWEQTAIAGHTANTLAKLRADVVAGNAPAAVQLK